MTAEDLADAIEQRINVLIEDALDNIREDPAIRLGHDTSREDLLAAIRQATNLP